MKLTPGAAKAGAAALLLILALQVGAFILSHSNTHDEPAVIAAGYSYIRTGRLHLETSVHPPLLKYLFGLFVAAAGPKLDLASPAFVQNRPYPFGHEFLYFNSVSPEVLLSLARLPGLLLSLALGGLVFEWARRWYGLAGGLVALAAYCLEPNLLAHSGLANMDLGLTCFLFAAYFFLERWLEERRRELLVAAGLLAGCAMATKLPGVYFPVWSGLLVWLRSRGTLRSRAAFTLEANVKLLGLALAVVALAYQVRFLPKAAELVGQMFQVIFTDRSPERYFNFLHGSLKEGGWPHYYLVAMAVKLPLPFLALAALGLWKLSGKERLALAVPVLSYLAILSVASKQNGLRYVLPALPFLCVAAGAATRVARPAWIAAALLGWQGVEAVRIAPNYLAYFNQAAGGPSGGHRWLVDSNLDWGQDFPLVRRLLLEEGRPETIVATLGNADHGYYFGPHQDLIAWFEDGYSHVNSSAPARELLIVSASFLHGFGLTDPEAFAWLRGRAPLAQPGYSTFVYDVTRDAESQFNVGKLYMAMRRARQARRQFERAVALAPHNPLGWLALGDARRAGGSEKEAAQAFRQALSRARDPELRRLVQSRLKRS